MRCFWGAIGILCGLVKVIGVIGYRYFNKANWGGELLQEHIAFYPLLMATMFLLIARGLIQWMSKRWEMSYARLLKAHVGNRTIALASVAASVVLGFAIVLALSGAYAQVWLFFLFFLWLVSLAEIAANPLNRSGQSKTYLAAMTFVGSLPLRFHLAV